MPRELRVYAIGWTPCGPLKIGYSQDPDRRIMGMRGCIPSPMAEELTILDTWPGGKELELALHHHFVARRHRRGAEWFDVTLEELQQAVQELGTVIEVSTSTGGPSV